MRKFTLNEQMQLNNFFIACNDMIGGRFILSDVKIEKILKSVGETPLIYDLISQALVNFNFEQQMRAAQTNHHANGGYFKMPQRELDIIALVFCILLEVKNKKISLQNFITDNFFSPQGYNVSYSNFAMVVLVPFKNAIANQLGCNEDGTPLENINDLVEENQISMGIPTEDEKMDAAFNLKLAQMRVALTELVSAVRQSKRLKVDQKEELLIVANAIADALKNENLKLIGALLIAFEYALKKVKDVRPYYNKFLNTFVLLV